MKKKYISYMSKRPKINVNITNIRLQRILQKTWSETAFRKAHARVYHGQPTPELGLGDFW